jgi:hypothetical protein
MIVLALMAALQLKAWSLVLPAQSSPLSIRTIIADFQLPNSVILGPKGMREVRNEKLSLLHLTASNRKLGV